MLGEYRGEWAICIGFKGEHLQRVREVKGRLEEEYPEQKYRIYNSRFPQYTFLFVTFASDRHSAHRIGLALVKKWFPARLRFSYWVKEVNTLKSATSGQLTL